MKGTKFVVVKMRELLKTAVFAVLGIVILVGLVLFFLRMGGQSDSGLYKNGTYEASLPISNTDAGVEVTVKNGRIAEVQMQHTSESIAVMYPLLEDAVAEVEQQVVQKQSTADITVSEKNTYSAQAVLQAVTQCLEQAKK